MGKSAYSLNNFCISANNGQDKGCLSCHPGWGNETKATNCLVCHGSKEINWDESFEDFNAFLKESEEDPEMKELANEIQSEIQLAVQSVSASHAAELRILSFLRRWW